MGGLPKDADILRQFSFLKGHPESLQTEFKIKKHESRKKWNRMNTKLMSIIKNPEISRDDIFNNVASMLSNYAEILARLSAVSTVMNEKAVADFKIILSCTKDPNPPNRKTNIKLIKS
jgi:hypothetical protein